MNGDFGEYQKRIDTERTYRLMTNSELEAYRVSVGESDLWVLSEQEKQAEIKKMLKNLRIQLKDYIDRAPIFATTLVPYPDDLMACELVRWMISASNKAGVGPMATVAGAIAASIGKQFPGEVMIENGGDIYLCSSKERVIAIAAGKSPFSGKIGLKLPPSPDGIGICTSAGTVGPSLSFGKADAVVIIAADTALADAVATGAGNLIQVPNDFEKALAYVQQIPEIQGALLIKNTQMAAWGELIEICPL